MLKRAAWLIFFLGWGLVVLGQGAMRLPPKPKSWSSCTDDSRLLETSDLQTMERILVQHYKRHSQRTYLLISDSTFGVPLREFGRLVLDEWERYNFRDRDAVLLVVSPEQRAYTVVWDKKYLGVLVEKDLGHFSERYLGRAENREELSAAVPAITELVLLHMGHRSKANALIGPDRSHMGVSVFLVCVAIMLLVVGLNRYWQEDYLSWGETAGIFWYLLCDLVVFSLVGVLLAFLILYFGRLGAVVVLFILGCAFVYRIADVGPTTSNGWELLGSLLGNSWGLTRSSLLVATLWLNLGPWVYVPSLLGFIVLHFPYFLFAGACMKLRQREARIKDNTYRHDHWLKFFWISIFCVLPIGIFFAKQFRFWFICGLEYLFDSELLVELNPNNFAILALLPVVWFFRHLTRTIYQDAQTYERKLSFDKDKIAIAKRLKIWSKQLFDRPDVNRLRQHLDRMAHDVKHHHLWHGKAKRQTWLWVFYVVDVLAFMALIARAPHCQRMTPLLKQVLDEGIQFLDDFRAHIEYDKEMPRQYGPFIDLIQSLENLKGIQFIVEGFISPNNYEMNFESYAYDLSFFRPSPDQPQHIQTLLCWLKYWHICSCLWEDDPMHFSESATVCLWRDIFLTQSFADEHGHIPQDVRVDLQLAIIDELQYRLEAINHPFHSTDGIDDLEPLLDQLYTVYLGMPKPAHISFH